MAIWVRETWKQYAEKREKKTGSSPTLDVWNVIAEVTCSAHAVGHAPDTLNCPVRVLQLIQLIYCTIYITNKAEIMFSSHCCELLVDDY